MDALPYLVLENIFFEVKRANGALLDDLLSCMLVCKAWHDTVATIVYASVTLDNARLIAFTAGFNADRYARNVLSVTLRLACSHSGSGPGGQDSQKQSHADLARCLRLFAPQLAAMCHLASFSFHAEATSTILSKTVVELLDSLSKTCLALEIHYTAYEQHSAWSRSQHPGSGHEGPHVCEAVRRLLPQLVHVKLHIPSICVGLFGLEPGNDSASPVAMPNLRTILINMSRRKGMVNTCGEASTYSGRSRYPKTWIAFTSAMERAFEDPAYRRRPGLVTTVIGPLQPQQLGGVFPIFTRANILDKEALVIQQRSEWDRDPRAETRILPSRNSWAPIAMVREGPAPPQVVQLPDGSEVIHVQPTSERLCEGEDGNWCSVVGGARLPREALLKDERRSTGSLRRLAELVGWGEGVDEDCPLHFGFPPRGRLLRMSGPPPRVPIDTVAEVRLNGAVKRAGEDRYLSLEHPKRRRVNPDTMVEGSQSEGEESELEEEMSEPEDEESEPEDQEGEPEVEQSEPVNAGGGLLSWVSSLFRRS